MAQWHMWAATVIPCGIINSCAIVPNCPGLGVACVLSTPINVVHYNVKLIAELGAPNVDQISLSISLNMNRDEISSIRLF